MRSCSMAWRALDRARAMNLAAAGEPPPRPGSTDMTRRRVLAALAGAFAAVALPHRPAWARAPRRVAIVGGGLAGLTALRRLRAAGIDATLYEARRAVGGRTRSVRGVFAPDYAFDEGGQLVNSDHQDMLGLVRGLGLSLIDRRATGSAHEVQIGWNGGAVAEAELAAGLRDIAARITADSDRLDRDYEAVAREIDAFSAADYMDRHGLPAGDARDALEAGIRTEYGVEPDRASALELVFNLPTVDGERLTRLSLSDERYLVDGGAGQVAQALAARMNDAIQLGKRLTVVALEPDGARLTFADGEEVSVDRAILALPAPLLREIRIEGPVPPLWRELIGEVHLGANEKMIVGYDRQAWRDALGTGGALWSPAGFCAGWDAASGAPPDAATPGAFTYFLGGAQVDAAAELETAELRDRFTRVAAEVIDDMPQPNGRARRTRWCDDPLTRGSYINFRPGQLTRFATLLTVEEQGEVRPSGAGPLLFAGEWLSDAWPGYMNGAVQTGRIAAEAALHGEVAIAA